MACFGLVHLIVGYLAVRIAVGSGGQEADQRGAVAEIGSTAPGKVVLWVLVVGLFAYGLWQILMAAKGYHWIGKDRDRTLKRVGSAARAVVVLGLAGYAASLAAGGGGGGSGDAQQQELTAKLLALPAGKIVVGLVALVVAGVAIASIVKGVRRTFTEDLDMHDLPKGTQRWVTRLGVAGYVAKGVVFGIIAVLIGFAAFTADAGQAGGLDAALRTLAAQPFGVFALVAVAAGFAAFGVYCFGAARAHKH
ncbi:hypothetical protein CFN78_02655 [Amycolatopsis antarctica]|uniref:DUF1206 domain-containing protein n=2 Tax=Amycolatopsis antarctica TaxID=1854586 RepID=A0A263DD49_9PSEU|nr:hypothetical protein CFN78_02655 [Amycolatopsis antarctica]